jgi:hypothetical protein
MLEENKPEITPDSVTVDQPYFGDGIDTLIQDIFIYALLAWAAAQIYYAIKQFGKMRTMLTWIKYVPEKSDLDKKLFTAVSNEFLEDVPKSFKDNFDNFIAENLEDYFQECIRKADMLEKEKADWKFSVFSTKLLGYILKKYTNDEIWPKMSTATGAIKNSMVSQYLLEPAHPDVSSLEVYELNLLLKHLCKQYKMVRKIFNHPAHSLLDDN